MKVSIVKAQINDVEKAYNTLVKMEKSLEYTSDSTQESVFEVLQITPAELANVRVEMGAILGKMKERFNNCEVTGWEE